MGTHTRLLKQGRSRSQAVAVAGVQMLLAQMTFLAAGAVGGGLSGAAPGMRPSALGLVASRGQASNHPGRLLSENAGSLLALEALERKTMLLAAEAEVEALQFRQRLTHAKELMGKSYAKSVVKKSEGVTQVNEMILQAIQESLSTPNKHWAAEIAQVITEQSYKYAFDPIFLMAMIRNESGFKPQIKGQFGEIGLMQILPATGQWVAEKYHLPWKGTQSLFRPKTNIELGAAYLDYLREQLGNHSRLYLSAFNMGIPNLKKNLKKNRTPFKYVNKVLSHYVSFYAHYAQFFLGSAAVKGPTTPAKPARVRSLVHTLSAQSGLSQEPPVEGLQALKAQGALIVGIAGMAGNAGG